MTKKTAEEIAKMTDDELVAAAAAGELGDVDGSDAEQREDANAAGEEEAEEEEQQEEEEQEEEQEGDANEGEEAPQKIVLAGVEYTQEQYDELLASLEEGGRAVPQSRLMEEAGKRRKLEEANRALELKIARQEGAQEALAKAEEKAREAMVAAKPKFDIAEAKQKIAASRKKVIALMREEEWAEAETLQAQIDADQEKIEAERDRIEEARRVAAIEESKVESQRAIRIVENRRLLESVANSMYSKYPFLNNESPEMDETAILAVQALRNQLIEQGEPVAAALRAAMTKIGEAELKKRGGARPGNKGGKTPKEQAEIERRAKALRKALAANARQPPKPGGAGNRLTRGGALTEKDIRKMSDEEFAAADKRGDLGDGRSPSQRARV
jgi:hypothetical protein